MSCGGIDIDATTKRKKNTKRSSKFRLAVIQFRNIDVAENDVRVAAGNWINNNIRKFILAFEDGRDMVTDSLEVYLLSLILFLDFGNLTIFIKRTSRKYLLQKSRLFVLERLLRCFLLLHELLEEITPTTIFGPTSKFVGSTLRFKDFFGWKLFSFYRDYSIVIWFWFVAKKDFV